MNKTTHYLVKMQLDTLRYTIRLYEAGKISLQSLLATKEQTIVVLADLIQEARQKKQATSQLKRVLYPFVAQ
jgi:hypothetical protein